MSSTLNPYLTGRSRTQKKLKRGSAPKTRRSASGFYYQVTISRRKTIGLTVKSGAVTLRLPEHISLQEGLIWLESKADWVKRQLRYDQRRQAQIPPRLYREGDTLPWLGEPKVLSIEYIKQRRKVVVESSPFGVHCRLSSSYEGGDRQKIIKDAIKSHWKNKAKTLLEELTHQQCQRMNLDPVTVNLRQTRSKWGHCTRDRRIQYNWLVCLAPLPIVRYLVVHECCHLIHFDHSPAFWSLVERYSPDWKASRQWLKTQGHTLVL